MVDNNLWYSFIQAKQALVEYNERSVPIDSIASEASADEWKVTIASLDHTAKFHQEANRTLGLRQSNFHLEQGRLGIPWETEITEQTLLKLKESADANYVTFEPAPVVEGGIGNWYTFPDLIYARVDWLLRQANLPIQWYIVRAEYVLAEAESKVKLEVALLVEPEPDNMTTVERNFKRWTHAQARLALNRTLTAAGFIAKGLKATLVTKQRRTDVRAESFGKLTERLWARKLTDPEQVYVCQLRYCFQLPVHQPESQSALLTEVATALTAAFPKLEVAANSNAHGLHFKLFLTFTKRVTQVLRLRNLLDEYQDRLQQAGYMMQLCGTDQLRFIASPDAQRQQDDAATRLSKLVGEEIGVGRGKLYQKIGRLLQVKYPTITISLAPELGPEVRRTVHTALATTMALTPNLTGEKEKLNRLSDALGKMTDPKSNLLNPTLRDALTDAALARGVADPAQLDATSSIWQEVANHSFLSLNSSQHQTVVATLLAPDMALVQGPPGTGKSTAISQIIWHLVRQELNEGRNCRILLTSETNTAVDNALEKLENPIHNLVKPIRIGSEEKMEEEGGRYALQRLMDWAAEPGDKMSLDENNAEVNPPTDNILRRWLNTIAKRAATRAKVPTELSAAWALAIDDLAPVTRRIVLEQYLENVNVIGATGGSLGEKSIHSTRTKPVYTKFYKQYKKVFKSRPTATEIKVEADTKASDNGRRQHKSDIRFDVVVIDEASKATPPELALALVYAYKAIIIGDHRQLPPLLDEDDFRSTLQAIGAHNLAASFSRKDAETSQFERLFTRPGVQPGVVSRFDTQYRMHPDINAVVEQFYADDNGLKCGIPLAAANNPVLAHPHSRHHGLSHPALLSSSDHLVWVQVDEPELLVGTSRINLAEVRATEAVLNCLAQSEGFAELQTYSAKPEDKEVALITFYGQQVRLLQEVARRYETSVPTRVQTVDKFQGMERNIVIVSLVRSNKIATSRFQEPDWDAYSATGGYPPQPSLGFAQFPNRLNVALSRAKRLLIIVGNSQHFSQNDCYRRVFEIVQERGKVVNYLDLLPYLPAS